MSGFELAEGIHPNPLVTGDSSEGSELEQGIRLSSRSSCARCPSPCQSYSWTRCQRQGSK